MDTNILISSECVVHFDLKFVIFRWNCEQKKKLCNIFDFFENSLDQSDLLVRKNRETLRRIR